MEKPSNLDLKLVLASDSLPSLPAVALKVLKLARASEPDTKALVRIIKSDPALTARVLKMANSSLFGIRQQVTSIEHAVPLLGATTVGMVVLSFSLVANSLPHGPLAESYQRIWKASLIQAVAAESLAKLDRRVVPAHCFVAGLLQDVGVLALLQVAPERYVPIFTELDQAAEESADEVER